MKRFFVLTQPMFPPKRFDNFPPCLGGCSEGSHAFNFFLKGAVYTVCMMYVWLSHIAKAWINRVRLPILLVVSLTGKLNSSLSPFAPENLVSRDGFGIPVPHQPAHLHAQAGCFLSRVGCFWRCSCSQKKTKFSTRTGFIALGLSLALLFYTRALGHHPTEGGCAGGD